MSQEETRHIEGDNKCLDEATVGNSGDRNDDGRVAVGDVETDTSERIPVSTPHHRRRGTVRDLGLGDLGLAMMRAMYDKQKRWCDEP